MTWIALSVAVVATVLWFPTFQRRLKLEQAIQFGREFYQVNVEAVVGVGAQRQFALRQISARREKTPQAIFFMLVPAVLGVCDELKRLELHDGLLQMQLAAAVSEQTVDEFMAEYEACSLAGYSWVKSAQFRKY